MNLEPKAEIEINEILIRELLNQQFPKLATLPLSFVDEGWDNVNYKLGSDLLVRLPRRQLGAELIKNEIKYLKNIALKLPIAIPAPLFVGQPSNIYPWNWTLLPWFDGNAADLSIPDKDQSMELAKFLKSLHHLKIKNPPKNQNRGVSLVEKLEALQPRIERLKLRTNCFSKHIEGLWKEALNSPSFSESRLLHGDLHARNIIVNKGEIKAIIDWGDLCSGDPATDLASFWMLFPEKENRDKALDLYQMDENLKKRAIGWAVYFAVVLLDTGLDSNPRHAKIGRQTFQNLETEI